jgi:hypothetical protein
MATWYTHEMYKRVTLPGGEPVSSAHYDNGAPRDTGWLQFQIYGTRCAKTDVSM